MHLKILEKKEIEREREREREIDRLD